MKATVRSASGSPASATTFQVERCGSARRRNQSRPPLTSSYAAAGALLLHTHVAAAGGSQLPRQPLGGAALALRGGLPLVGGELADDPLDQLTSRHGRGSLLGPPRLAEAQAVERGRVGREQGLEEPRRIRVRDVADRDAPLELEEVGRVAGEVQSERVGARLDVAREDIRRGP